MALRSAKCKSRRCSARLFQQAPRRWPSMEHPHSGSEGTKPEVIDILDIENHAKTKGTAAPPAKQYAFRVDKDRVVVDEPLITGREILAKVGKTPELFKL